MLAVSTGHLLALDVGLVTRVEPRGVVKPDVVLSVRTEVLPAIPAAPSPLQSPAPVPAPPVKPATRTVDDTAPGEPATSPVTFLPADRLDRRPTPVSAPDLRWLDALADQPVSGLPLRLRLFITAAGEVVAVEPVEVSELDAFALPALEAMFRDTAYVPGRYQGRDVASQIDLEVQLDSGPQ